MNLKVEMLLELELKTTFMGLLKLGGSHDVFPLLLIWGFKLTPSTQNTQAPK